MAKKWHIDVNGIPAECKAIVRPCPKGEINHYSSREEAQIYSDFLNEIKANSALSLNKDSISMQDAINRGKELERIFKDPMIKRFDTKNHYFNSELQIWSEERSKQHEEIVNMLLEKYQDVPCDRKVVFMGGLSGAGKTTTLKKYAGFDLNSFANINADDIKEILADNGMIPEIDGLTPLECSTLVHEESSYLADLVNSKLAAQGRNILFDCTMKNFEKAKSRMDMFHRSGYNYEDMEIHFVNVSIETSKERSLSRYKAGLDEYLKEGNNKRGARYIPNSVYVTQEPTRDGYQSINHQVVDLFKIEGDAPYTIYEYDNNGDSPKMIDVFKK